LKRFLVFKRQKLLQKVNLCDSIKTYYPDKVEIPGNTKKSALSKRKTPLESFEMLVTKYEPMIYKIIHSLHIYKNWEEYYQIGLIGLWEASTRFDPTKGNFMNYAYSIVKGKMQTEMTKSRLHEERNIYAKEEFWEGIEDSNSEMALEEKLLLSYCETLSKKQLKWLMYTLRSNLTVKEIAEKEGVSISAVKAWRTGAREKMKSRMDIEKSVSARLAAYGLEPS
jgi:RNA polymerase sigma factor (sigma-70 family)